MANIFNLIVRMTGNGQGLRDDLEKDKAAVQKFNEDLKKIDDATAKIKVDDAESQAKIDLFKQDLDSIRNEGLNIDVKDGNAKAKIDALKVKLSDMKNAIATIKVDDVQAQYAITKVNAELDKLSARTVEPKVKPNASRGTGTLGALLAAAIPAASPLGAVGVGAGMGLASAFAPGLAGSAGLAAVSVSNLKPIFSALSQYNKYMKAASQATTIKQQNADLAKAEESWKGLDAAQMKAVHSLQSFESFWKSFSASFQNPVLTMFSSGLKTLQNLLTDMKPAITGAASAFNTLLQDASKALNSPFWKQFFSWMGSQAESSITSFGTTIGNLTKGLAGLLEAFQPMSTSMENGLVSLSAKFATWATHLSSTQGFQKFLDYVKREGPQVMQLIGQLAQLVGRLLVAMAPVGAIVVKIATDIAKLANSLLKAHPQLGTFAVAVVAGVGAIKLLSGPVKGATSAITSFVGAFGKDGAIRTFPKKVKNAFDAIGKGSKKVVSATKSIASFTASLVKNAAKAAANAAVYTGKFIASMAKSAASIAAATAKLVAQGAIFVAQKASVIAYTVAQAAMTAGTALATAATTAFGVALKIATGPIGLVIAALVALGIGIYELIKHWSTVKQDTEKIWNDIAAFFSKTWKSITKGVSNAWNAIVGFFKKYGLDILAALTGPVGMLALYLYKHWGTISADAKKAWQSLKNTLHGLWHGAVTDAENIFNGLGSFFTHLWTEAEQWGSNLVHHVAQGITNAIGTVRNAVSRVASTISNFLGFHSPAKEGPGSEADVWMPNLMNMLIGGIKQGTPKLQAALNSALSMPQWAVSPGIASMVQGGGLTVRHIHSGQVGHTHDGSVMWGKPDRQTVNYIEQQIYRNGVARGVK